MSSGFVFSDEAKFDLSSATKEVDVTYSSEKSEHTRLPTDSYAKK